MREKGYFSKSVIIISLFLSLLSSAAYDYITYRNCSISVIFFVRAMFLSALYCFLFAVSKYCLNQKNEPFSTKDRLGSVINYLFGDKVSLLRQTLVLGGIILALWLPYLAVSYPGNMSNDTTGQIPMFFSIFEEGKDYAVQDQHPVFTTMIFGSIIYSVNLLTHNMHFSLFVCIFLQMIMTALVFSFAIVWMRRKWKVKLYVCLFLVAFLTLLPLVPLMVISLSKDTLFSWIYVLFLLLLFEIVRQDYAPLKKRKVVLLMILLCFGVCLTKKLGVYVVLGSLSFFVLFCRKDIKTRFAIFLPLATSVILMFVIMPRIIEYTHIYPSPTKEMYALPFQQTTLTYLRRKDELSESDIKRIDAILDVSTLEDRYNPIVGDAVKGTVDNNSNFSDYLRLYLKLLLRYPGDYIDAFATQVAGLFVPYKILPIFDNHWHTWNGDYFDESFFEKPAFSAAQSERLEQFYTWFTTVPILNLSTFSITYVVFLPALLLICVLERKKYFREILVVMPIAASLAGLMVASVVYYGNEAMRYIMPFVYTTPLLIGFSQYLLMRDKIPRKSVLPGRKRSKATLN